MTEVPSALAANFSVICGGPVHRLLVRLGLEGENRRYAVRRTLLFILLTWLPLLVLSIIQGQAYGRQIQIPFLRDFAVNVRFLIAVPILILAEAGIDRKWRTIILQFLKSELVSENELASFEAAIKATARLRDSFFPEGLLAVAAFFPSIFILKTELLMGGVSSWHTVGGALSNLSFAGSWFNLVSTPFFRFLLLRWIWRLFLATFFLWRVSRIRLYLIATHTDLAAGLGFLSQGPLAFSPIVFAGGAVIAAQVGNAIAYQGVTLSSLKYPMIAYGVMAIILLIAPLLVFTPALFKVQRRALLEYGDLVTRHNHDFDRKWIRREDLPEDGILGNPDPSSLIDLGASFTVIRQMGYVPIDKQTLIILSVAAALPMITVVVFATPVDELVSLVLKMLG